MRFQHLSEWLDWQKDLHPNRIDLGLERCGEVAARMGLDQPAFPVITVTGTNGKGACVTMLSSILGAAGYRVGAYLSPYLLDFTELVRLDGVPIPETDLVRAFAVVDQGRGCVSLTDFEFQTLGAVEAFRAAGVDVAVLEVGMGGARDAVNVVNGQGAVVTSIGLDHTSWLGDSRDAVGREKAGIFRSGCPAVCGDPNPPPSLATRAEDIGAGAANLWAGLWDSSRPCIRPILVSSP